MNLKFLLTNSIIGFTSIGLLSTPVLGLPRATSLLISDSPKEVIDQVWQIIYRDYLDSSGTYTSGEWKKLRKTLLSRTYPNTSDSYEAIRGMLDKLNDPYTRFLDPKEFKEMRIDTTGELTGVGIKLSLDKKTDELVVVTPIEGTPAFKAGVKPKDVIISIDKKSTVGMNIQDAVRLIRGEVGTKVNLGLRRKDKFIDIPILRARIEISAVESKLKNSLSGIKFGYIRLKQFNANASKEMRITLKNLEEQNVRGYVLDLRSNPGGLLESSVDIARQWLNKGTIVSTRTRDGIRDIRKANGRALTKKPVVVLVNEGTASASEILSVAIQENNRGLLVGKKTFGKGLVQSVRGLTDGSGLTVTIAKYLTPKGFDIHRNGIIPDIEVGHSESEVINFSIEDIATDKDNQYKVAEKTLLKSLGRSIINRSYDPYSSNLKYALKPG